MNEWTIELSEKLMSKLWMNDPENEEKNVRMNKEMN